MEVQMRFSFDEKMSGFIYPGETDPLTGKTEGEKDNLYCNFDVCIQVDDLDNFIKIDGHTAKLTGTVSAAGLGRDLPILRGTFNIFDIGINPRKNKTQKKIEYHIWFKSEINQDYYLHGQKNLFHDQGEFDVIEDMTTLYTEIYKGSVKDEQNLYATGILYFHFTDTPELIASMNIEGADSFSDKVAGITKFMDFAYEEILEIYFNRIGFFYRTDYQNLVLSGPCQVDGKKMDFFFYGGAHDKGFPWGDEQSFWDISLVLSDPDDRAGKVEKLLIADITLKDKMDINIDAGNFTYTGQLYRLKQGYVLSFSDDLVKPDECEALEPVQASLEFKFTAYVPEENNDPVDSVLIPLGIPSDLGIPVIRYINDKLKKFFPNRHPLGIRLGVRAVALNSAEILLNGKPVKLDTEASWGEAEESTFNYVKEPTLFYNYFCGIKPAEKSIRLHIEGDVLFDDTTYPLKNLFDHVLRTIAKPHSSVEILLKNKLITKRENAPKPLTIKDDTILEVNYDHFSTGVLQRRVVLLSDESGGTVWALEEDMKRINLSRIEPDAREKCVTHSPLDNTVAKVAVFQSKKNWPETLKDPHADKPGILDNLKSLLDFSHSEKPSDVQTRIDQQDQDKKALLRKVIQETNFKKALVEKADESGKSKEDLVIAIKPNFMFLYNKTDHTTYTDPVLIHELVDFLYENGFRKIYVVEAHSTYGEYFQNRDVTSVAKYIGLESCEKYTVVDLSDFSDESQWITPEPLLPDPISDHKKIHKIWADADFRISFAKNKTHIYAYYSLCLKNIFGALPLSFKFKEYHCKRGIYGSAIEFITRYPIHFGFIDAYVSADGPFGVFADKTPNYTRTIIGSENIVAIDWVGASKMGLNPMISEYMQRSVKRFGKPHIILKGDIKQELYSPWENVPVQLSWLTNTQIDQHYKIGNIFYSTFSNMDETAFPRKNDSWIIKLGRLIDKPIRDMFFKQVTDTEKMRQMYAKGPFDEPE